MTSAFDELAIASMTARNRFVRAATAESLATPAGCPTVRLAALYGELASGGVGTIITGYAYVRPDGKPSEGALGIYDDSFAQDYRRLVDAVHARGANIVMQLVYGGSKSKLAPDDPRRIAASAETMPNVSILGASSVEDPRTHLVPTEATTRDLEELASAFGAAAARAKAYGFDGVEVHAAHGYLLSQFLSRTFNVREDAYGAASLENRARLAVSCVAAVREAVGAGFPVFAKVNACDSREDPGGMRGGLGEDESARVASWLVEAGVDCIDVSGDWHSFAAQDVRGTPFFADFGARLARETGASIIVTGGWRRLDVIETRLADSGIAGIAMSRPLICEPDLVARWASGDVGPSACTACGHCQSRPGIPCALRE